MNSSRTLRLARFLLSHPRLAGHWDPITKQKYPFLERQKTLDKYKGQKDIFGTFTTIKKLGMNPSTSYNTPIGVYAYQIGYVIKKYDPVSNEFNVPFPDDPADRLYLQVFRVKEVSRCLFFRKNQADMVTRFKIGSVTKKQAKTNYDFWRTTIDKLRVYYHENLDSLSLDTRESINSWMQTPRGLIYESIDLRGPNSSMRDDVERYFGIFELFTYSDLPGFFRGPWGRRLREIKDDEYVGYPQDVLSFYEKGLQNNLKEDIHFPYEDRFRDVYFSSGNKDEDHYSDFRDVVLAPSQRVACDQAFVWNATRHLSGFNPPKWADLMRRMGLIGAVDYGTGTIHPNEIYQAVFFDPGSIQPLEFIHNKSQKYDDYYGNSKRDEAGRRFYSWATREDAVKSIDIWLSRDISNLKTVQNSIFIGMKSNDLTTAWRHANDIESVLHDIFRVFGWMNSHSRLIDPAFLEEKKREARDVVQDTFNLVNDLVEKTRLVGIDESAQARINTIFNRLNLMLKALR